MSWQILVITFLTGFAVDRLLLWASARRLPPFFSQLAAAAFITLVATGVSALGSPGVDILLPVDPTLIVVGGIILLVAGFLLKISILSTIGLILIVVGLVLMVMGRMGRAVGGRRHYY